MFLTIHHDSHGLFHHDIMIYREIYLFLNNFAFLVLLRDGEHQESKIVCNGKMKLYLNMRMYYSS